jgi:hypothetical protein
MNLAHLLSFSYTDLHSNMNYIYITIHAIGNLRSSYIYLIYYPKWLPRILSCSRSSCVFLWGEECRARPQKAHLRLCFEDMFRARETSVLDDLLGTVKRMKGTSGRRTWEISIKTCNPFPLLLNPPPNNKN